MPLAPTTAKHSNSFGETDVEFRDIRDLITHPGVRLVMPSEQQEDFDTGLRYRREFDGLVSIANSSSNDLAHDNSLTSFGRVYINSTAEPYMKREPLRFPVGSVIIREMLWKASDTEPHLLSVMVKRERGFNPIVNDWEFAVVNAGMSRLKRGDSVRSCVQCHAEMRSADFLFKSYLPN